MPVWGDEPFASSVHLGLASEVGSPCVPKAAGGRTATDDVYDGMLPFERLVGDEL